MLTERQQQLLINIVDSFVKTTEPVSSGQMIADDLALGLSSASVRNEMAELEKQGYIVKSDSTSLRTSGRIPTNKGYEFYLDNLKENQESFASVKVKLDKVFKERKENINEILDESIKIINEATNTLIITTDLVKDAHIRDFKAYKVSDEKCVVVIVSSDGTIHNEEIEVKGINYDDFEIAINKVAELMIGTPIVDIESKARSIKEIMLINMNNIEESFEQIIRAIFSKMRFSNENFIGMNNLVSTEYMSNQEEIKKIFNFIQSKSIWEFVDKTSGNQISGRNLTIDLETIDGVSVINKEFDFENRHKKLTIIGSKTQDYEKLFGMLKYLEDAILKEDEEEE